MSSAIVQVQDGSNGWVATDGGVNVTAGNVISIRLETSGDVNSWQLECFGTDEVTATPPTLTNVSSVDGRVTTPSTVVTFTMPGGNVGRALVFQSVVDGGGPGKVVTFGIYHLTTLGNRVGAVGEEREGDSGFGWAAILNPLIRNAGEGGGSGLPSLANQQYAALMEDPAGTLIFQRITQDMILPAYSIASFVKTGPNGGNLLYRRGDTVAIDGTNCITTAMTYGSGPPTAANVADGFIPGIGVNDTATGGWPSLVSPFSSATRSGSVRRNGVDLSSDPTWNVVLTATKGSNSKQAQFTLQWTRDVYWGVGTAGQNTAGFITALAGTQLSPSRSRSFTVNPVNQKVYYAVPKAYGTPTATLNGFPAAFNAPIEVMVTSVNNTNTNNVVSTYYLLESVNLLTEADSSGLTFVWT